MDLAPFVERHFSSWGWSRLIRSSIIALVTFALVSFGTTRAYQRNEERLAIQDGQRSEGVLVRLSSPENPLEFTEVHPAEGSRPYGIAWIYGSEATIHLAPQQWLLQGRADYELTEVLAKYLTGVDGRSVVVHEYRQPGIRTGDQRRAILHAAAAPEVDAILVPMAPMWLFNDYLQFNPSNRRGNILRFEKLSSIDYSVALAVLRPSEFVGAILKDYVPFFRYRYDLNTAFYRMKALPFPTHSPKVSLSGDMVMLWLNLHFPPTLIFDTPPSLRGSERLRAALMMGRVSRETIGAQMFKADLRTMAASKKPVILYMQPLHPGIRDDLKLLQRLDEFAALVRGLVEEVGAPNIKFAPETAFMEQAPSQHRDLYHLRHGQDVVESLVALLEGTAGRRFERRTVVEIYRDTQHSPIEGARLK